MLRLFPSADVQAAELGLDGVVTAGGAAEGTRVQLLSVADAAVEGTLNWTVSRTYAWARADDGSGIVKEASQVPVRTGVQRAHHPEARVLRQSSARSPFTCGWALGGSYMESFGREKDTCGGWEALAVIDARLMPETLTTPNFPRNLRKQSTIFGARRR